MWACCGFLRGALGSSLRRPRLLAPHLQALRASVSLGVSAGEETLLVVA